MKKKIILSMITILIMIFISSISLGATTTIFTDTFNYVDEYVNHGYTYSSNCAFASDTDKPIPSYFSTQAFGYANTTICPIGALRSVTSVLGANATSGAVTTTYNYALLEDSTAFRQPIEIQLKQAPLFTERIGFIHHDNATGTMRFRSSCGTQLGCVECTLNLSSINLSVPMVDVIGVIEIDIDNQLYSWSINGVSTNCVNIDIGNSFPITAITLINQLDDLETQNVTLDNIAVTSSADLGVFGLGSPCVNDSQCLTDRCFIGVCDFKTRGLSCGNDRECMSDACENGVCRKASLSQGMNAIKNQQVGDDDDTNNMISLFFMIGVAGAFTFAGIIGGSVTGGAVAGAVVFYTLGMLFAVIGWLSGYIILGMIIVALLVIVIAVSFRIGGG